LIQVLEAPNLKPGVESTNLAALVFDILQAVDKVRNAPKTEANANNRRPSAISQLSISNLLLATMTITSPFKTHCVVPPTVKPVAVSALLPQAGQSTGADEADSAGIGVAVLYCCVGAALVGDIIWTGDCIGC